MSIIADYPFKIIILNIYHCSFKNLNSKDYSMKTVFFSFWIIMFSLLACNKEDNNDPQPKPGSFVLTELKQSGLKSANTDSIKTEFNLGDLYASKEFYFILSNAGDNPIYDVRFVSDNPAFTITPSYISTLYGSNSNSTMIPLISMGVTHGVKLNGVGYTSLLPMNENSATFTVTGNIEENGKMVEIQSKFRFNVNAKVMDIALYDNESEIDLFKPAFSMSSNLGGLGFIRGYIFTTTEMKIKNIGNVDINFTVYPRGKKDATYSLKVDSIAQVTLNQPNYYIELESNGAVTDDSKIQLGNNGNGFFSFETPIPYFTE